MGYALVMGVCYGCKRTFGFNPNRVPSVRVPPNNVREPICLDCVNRANPERIRNGLPPIVPHPDAYLPEDENAIAWDQED